MLNDSQFSGQDLSIFVNKSPIHLMSLSYLIIGKETKYSTINVYIIKFFGTFIMKEGGGGMEPYGIDQEKSFLIKILIPTP
jgi:hypothetical protein